MKAICATKTVKTLSFLRFLLINTAINRGVDEKCRFEVFSFECRKLFKVELR